MTAATETPAERVAWLRRLARLRPRGVPAGLRARILAWFIGLLTLATLAAVLATEAVLELRVDQRIDGELAQEAAELRRLAGGNDPETGRPFGPRAERIFEVFLERNVPSRHEALMTFVEGRPFLRSRAVLPYRLDEDPALVARWARLQGTDRGRVQTPAGPVEYLAVPLRVDGQTAGVFVAAVFRDRVAGDVHDAVFAVAAVGLGALLLGSLLAWRLADRVVKPVAELTRMARAITETDLSRRIPVRGRDEVAQLAETFNEMVDRLERAFAAQRRLVADAGHELRTPITIVRGHLELIDEDPASREETLALVDDELGRMSRLVEDLLLLSKSEQPDFLDLGTVDLGALTDELYGKVEPLAPGRWRLEGRGSGRIVGDRQRLTQAVLQLAQNAIDHGPPQGPLALGSSIADGEAALWVRDAGRGVPPELRETLFDRFRRGGRRSEGAGLGLAIVKAIADAHRGRVDVAGGSGGTSFRLVVPVDRPHEHGDEP